MPVARSARALLALVLVLGAVACSGDDDGDEAGDGEAGTRATTVGPAVDVEPVSTRPVPGAAFEEGRPADAGLSPAAVAAFDRYAEERDSNCVAVVHDGVLVHERYWNGTTAASNQEIFSATKSITAFLVGIAQDQGLLDIDDSASAYIPEWQGTPAEAVTVRDLLSNVSGRHYDFTTDYVEMAIGAPDKTALAVDLRQADPPGEVWAYNNSAIQTLEQVLEVAVGGDVADFAQEHLFEPIGMTSAINHDASGNTLTFMGGQAGCQDLARFGLLALNEGAWGDRQVVAAEYVREATSSSQDLNSVYGYLWWLNSDGPRVAGLDGAGDPVVDDGSYAWPDTPPDAYAAQGLGGQYAIVIPSRDLVITRLGRAGGDASMNELVRLLLS